MTIQMEIASSAIDQENNFGIMGYDHDHDGYDDADSLSSNVTSVESSDDEYDDVFKETNSYSSNNSHALGNMSDLLQQLPFKRGLSKHFQGKSQSFTSLSKVMCIEDLAKPENPYNKRLKSCKSYVGLSRVVTPPKRSASSSKLFSKNISSGAACSSVSNNTSRLATYS